MQRALSIAFLLIYLGLTVGVNVLHHTCGGTTDANFAPVSQEDPCGCADVMDPSDRCCTVSITTFQLHDEQVATAIVSAPSLDATHVIYPLSDVTLALVPTVMPSASPESPPPRAVPANIFNCSFLV